MKHQTLDFNDSIYHTTNTPLDNGCVTTGGSSFTYSPWNTPELVKTVVNADSIELIYRESIMYSTTAYFISDRVFKIIYSCVDGKWNVSERIYGTIVPPSEEYYEF